MRIYLLFLLTAGAMSLSAAEIDSGPKPGQAAPALKVKDLTGQYEGKIVDYLNVRANEATVVVWLTDEGWSRPTARYLRAIDTHITKQNKGVYQVVVRMTEKQEEVARQLPRAQQSIRLVSSALTLYPGAASGPEAWRLDPKASVTAVLVHQGKIVARFAEAQVNETSIQPMLQAIQKAVE